jgi:hypothetical protein
MENLDRMHTTKHAEGILLPAITIKVDKNVNKTSVSVLALTIEHQDRRSNIRTLWCLRFVAEKIMPFTLSEEYYLLCIRPTNH